MLIEINALKRWYFEERKYLEQLPVFEREVNLTLAYSKEKIAKKFDTVSLETLQKKFGNKRQFSFIFENGTNSNLAIKSFVSLKDENYKQAQEELRKAYTVDRKRIPPNKDVEVYTEYMFQFMKVECIEEILEECELDPEEIYEEFKNIE